ncbi:UBP-type zinc finger domain-containing protein [Cellulomonas humilata]|uniref:UBP-type zinc finger domain-containing protein n=1 Tax=Cellulomonas humilata TaxID=144055 RepID=A0A7Y6A3D9_9CELL|nr:UBP-type zinc finger domain-containing protein [Cellulomonas humilata]
MTETTIDPTVPPSGTGCVECDATDGWWFHLRRCATCGHVGCCDTSPSQHATAHFRETGHPVMRTFEPGEDWFWSYPTDDYTDGPALAAPEHRPLEQTVPGPAGRVPDDWRRRLH